MVWLVEELMPGIYKDLCRQQAVQKLWSGICNTYDSNDSKKNDGITLQITCTYKTEKHLCLQICTPSIDEQDI